MKDVYEYAKYFMKNGADTTPNTFDGNMKLQKLLVFANLINLAKYGEPLFTDEIMAFQNGCVVEKVRMRYKYDYLGFCAESEKFNPDFNEKEYSTLSDTISIFGKLSARELSDLNHEFDFWKVAYSESQVFSGYYDKNQSIVNLESIKKELPKIQAVLSSYNNSKNNCMYEERINGITFYYNPKEIDLNEDIIAQLYSFTNEADDSAYTVHLDEGELMIY